MVKVIYKKTRARSSLWLIQKISSAYVTQYNRLQYCLVWSMWPMRINNTSLILRLVNEDYIANEIVLSRISSVHVFSIF